MSQKVADPHSIEEFLLNPLDTNGPAGKYHVQLKDGRCFYGWPQNINPINRYCRFVSEYEDSDCLIDFRFDDIDYITLP